ncbi:pentatricopeptide repeat-containing protein [Carex littledalei]|uniref:Pentatricopeptide repeat-containing protein n=1 Tax=Carex littledalei TaxID=544730 RepID=A0A833QQF8_9POAL|nr:pentatricopeptide repeat-containing protein [Carex littledalei]
MGPRLTSSAISSLSSQILRSLQSPSPRLPPLPLPLSTALILSVLRSSPSPLLSLRFFLHAFSVPSPLSPYSLSLFSSHLLPSLPLLLSPSPYPPFPPYIMSFRALFSLCLHPISPPPPWLPSFSHDLLNLMQSDFNCKPDTFCYNTVIRIFTESERAEEALSLFQEMCSKQISPNLVTFVTLVKGLARMGKVEAARAGLIDSLVSKGEISVRECYCLIATCFSKNERFDEAKILVKRMLENGIELDASAINSLLRGFCEKRQFLDGYYWLQENGYDSVDSDVYSCLLAGLCKERFIKEAVDMGREVVERSIRIENRFVDCIIEGLKSFGEFELANRIEVLKEVDIIPSSSHSFGTIG